MAENQRDAIVCCRFFRVAAISMDFFCFFFSLHHCFSPLHIISLASIFLTQTVIEAFVSLFYMFMFKKGFVTSLSLLMTLISNTFNKYHIYSGGGCKSSRCSLMHYITSAI